MGLFQSKETIHKHVNMTVLSLLQDEFPTEDSFERALRNAMRDTCSQLIGQGGSGNGIKLCLHTDCSNCILIKHNAEYGAASKREFKIQRQLFKALEASDELGTSQNLSTLVAKPLRYLYNSIFMEYMEDYEPLYAFATSASSQEMRCVLLQLLMMYDVILSKFPEFQHRDLSGQNVLVSKHRTYNVLRYKQVSLSGFRKIAVIDFGESRIDAERLYILYPHGGKQLEPLARFFTERFVSEDFKKSLVLELVLPYCKQQALSLSPSSLAGFTYSICVSCFGLHVFYGEQLKVKSILIEGIKNFKEEEFQAGQAIGLAASLPTPGQLLSSEYFTLCTKREVFTIV